MKGIKKNGVLQLEALSCKAAEVARIFSCLQVHYIGVGRFCPPNLLGRHTLMCTCFGIIYHHLCSIVHNVPSLFPSETT